MKKWIVAGVVLLSGCTQITRYETAVKTPAPADLQGVWQTDGPQRGLVSDQAMANLIITADGDTLDCRQWQRVIAKPGKLTRVDGDYVNVNRQVRVMPLVREGATLHYDKLTLRRVDRPTIECQKALDAVKAQPEAAVIQTIQIDALADNPASGK
ncbi:lipoprotein YedD [Pantoea sp. 1.19]|uniref:lipoprotein YedD n=1 Tax=Pantoea sp. 1.19 TaxID=1925589 RepID=UPI000948BCD0|nr:lipoprotein YedD [Pantoea sp. 1.19]